jgi:hypothetical protein
LSSRAKAYALNNVRELPLKIVEPLIVETLENNPNWEPMEPAVLAKAVSRVKSKLFAKNQNDLFFQIQHVHIPNDFYRGEVLVGSKRHLIFMTAEHISLLKYAVRWYVDGTFKIISDKPFTQLFSINGFIRKEHNLKQIPLCFIFMSGRTERDYRKGFEKIVEIVGGECSVEEFVTNFERAIWRGAKNALPERVKFLGCAFHWCQVVYRNLKKIGLVKLYKQNEYAHKILKRVMSLHLIPHEKIPKMFNYLEKEMEKLFQKGNALYRKKMNMYWSTIFFSCMLEKWCKTGLPELCGFP